MYVSMYVYLLGYTLNTLRESLTMKSIVHLNSKRIRQMKFEKCDSGGTRTHNL